MATKPRQMVSYLLIWLLAVLAGSAVASTETPDVLVKRTVEEVLQVIKQTPQRSALQQLAEQKVLPNFDFHEMTRLAMGTNWRKATPEQQRALESGFRGLLVNIYTSALTQSGPQQGERTVEVKPLPPGAAHDEAFVRTVVKDKGGQRVAIDYRMSSREGRWKVYDVLVEGISLVTNYRASFDGEVSRGGVDGLIKTLEQKNRASLKS
ncbi:MAG: hypothetical protein A2Z64_03280 [Betaproteobacteria bacterium RIFCSPLOWO2_02_67_12]|nr:MAG: hypothetical protein A2Z64_03280 [Betaproteobacteria bacterium RIFCSPLOWO2_02_67_12]